jgi:hypothetical protein
VCVCVFRVEYVRGESMLGVRGKDLCEFVSL